jgi:hypothetical protein
MIAYLDIENAHTKEVVTLELDILINDENEFVFDISKLNEKQLLLLRNAIDEGKKYTDIELFFVDDDNIPFFGTDYNFNIDSNHLKGTLNRKGR